MTPSDHAGGVGGAGHAARGRAGGLRAVPRLAGRWCRSRRAAPHPGRWRRPPSSWPCGAGSAARRPTSPRGSGAPPRRWPAAWRAGGLGRDRCAGVLPPATCSTSTRRAPTARPTPSGPERYRRWVALLERHRPRPGRRLRLRLGRVPAARRRDARRGRARPAGGHARSRRCPPRRARPGDRGRGGAARVAAGPDDRGHHARSTGRHFDFAPELHKVRVPPRPARRRRRRLLHPALGRLQPAGHARGSPPRAAPASRRGSRSRPGTTRASPAITSSSPSGSWCKPTTCPGSRRRSAG